MKDKNRIFHVDRLLAFCMVSGLFLIAGLFFDFYYDLNDDVLLKDILAGAYSGTPDAHSIQMLYPLSLVISLFYRILPMFPWQGLFLCGCHGICFYLLARRSLSFVKKPLGKVFLLLTQGTLILTLFIWELVIVQYTITAALLASCACFLVLTSQKKETWKEFLKEQRIPIVLTIVAFNIRSEMLLLMSPFIAFVGIFTWSCEKEIFSKENRKKYPVLIGLILLGTGASLLFDYVAYSGTDWKTFRDFFNARTKVYDYTWYPEYEEAESFYKGIGVTKETLTLIDNYNFGLDQSIDAKLLWSIADYAKKTGTQDPFFARTKTALSQYKWRTFHGEDSPYSVFVIAAYTMIVVLAVVYKEKSVIWKLPLLVVFRTIPWMYVLLADRVPARISHPLYYMELIILCGWILFYYRGRENENEKESLGNKVKNPGRFCVVAAVLLLSYAILSLPGMWQKTQEEMIRRMQVNEKMLAFDAYASRNRDNYYYMDVYSTVAFSEKMYEDVDNTQKNYDILGGWAFKSPLQKQATGNFSKEQMTPAQLLLLDNFYFVMDKSLDPSFIKEFYMGLGMTVELTQKDIIGEGENPFIIWKVESIN